MEESPNEVEEVNLSENSSIEVRNDLKIWQGQEGRDCEKNSRQGGMRNLCS